MPSLPPDVKAILDRLISVLESDDKQNSLLPEPYRSQIAGGLDCDELPNGRGDFGRTPSNPIPTNGPLGQVLFLSRLRVIGAKNWLGLRPPGSPLMFHRVRAEDGPIGAVDVYEVCSLDRAIHETLFLSMYHPRKSKKLPSGYTYAAKLDPRNWTYGVNHIVPNFPQKLDAYIRKWQMEMLGVPLPVARVREAINGSEFRPSVLDESERGSESVTGQLRDDFLKLLHASRDPRFAGHNIAIGCDGLLRPDSQTTMEPSLESSVVQFRTKPKVFQKHRYDGSKPISEWLGVRLRIISIQAANAIRRELRELDGVVVVPGCWYECIYLAYFFLTLALMKAEFGKNPTHWADETIKSTLGNLLIAKFDRKPRPDLTVGQAVKTYRQRYAEYWGNLDAFRADATSDELIQYALHLVYVFSGTRNVMLAPIFLGWSNKILSQFISSVHELAAVGRQHGAA